jgi:cysteine-rich repeat protein
VFLTVDIVSPNETQPPAFDSLDVTVSAEIDGVREERRLTLDNADARGLPLSFFLEFAPEREGLAVSLALVGRAAGEDSFSASGTGQVGEAITLTAAFCGDGATQSERGEECDDRNRTAGDGCRADCTIERCGDGIRDPQEVCDDGNTTNGDGCQFDCSAEVCGDGIQDSQEECDDGNNRDDDGCDADCTNADVVQLALGDKHTCALLDNGKVRCWGDNAFGQLGYGNTEDIGDDETPASAGDVNVGELVQRISAGSNHTCAVLITLRVRCWGNNAFGQLGYGNTNNIGDNESPADAGDVDALAIEPSVTDVVTGSNHTCILFDFGGNIKCWGDNTFGQLGNGNTIKIGDDETPRNAPFISLPDPAPIVKIVAGGDHNCALSGSGSAYCWGRGLSGELGYGNVISIGDNETLNSHVPLSIGGVIDDVAVFSNKTCILIGRSVFGSIRCWGGGSTNLGYGQLVTFGDNETPGQIPSILVGGNAQQVSIGGAFICSLLSTQDVMCWGGIGNNIFPLGYGAIGGVGDDEDPAEIGVVDLGAKAISVATGSLHICVVTDDGQVKCWGVGFDGRLGYGDELNIGDDEVPSDVGDVPLF